jgi:hypothetical protein
MSPPPPPAPIFPHPGLLGLPPDFLPPPPLPTKSKKKTKKSKRSFWNVETRSISNSSNSNDSEDSDASSVVSSEADSDIGLQDYDVDMKLEDVDDEELLGRLLRKYTEESGEGKGKGAAGLDLKKSRRNAKKRFFEELGI